MNKKFNVCVMVAMYVTNYSMPIQTFFQENGCKNPYSKYSYFKFSSICSNSAVISMCILHGKIYYILLHYSNRALIYCKYF